MAEVKRDPPNEKLIGLVNSAKDLFDEMEHLSSLHRRWFRISAKRFTFFRDFSTFIAFLINMIILFTYYREFDSSIETGRNGMLKNSYYEVFGGDTHSALEVLKIVRGLGVLQLVTAGLMVLFWLILRVPLILKKQWRELNHKQKLMQVAQKKYDEDDDDLQAKKFRSEHQIADLSTYKTSQTVQLLLREGPEASIFKKDGKRNFGNMWTTFTYHWINTHFLLSDGTFQYLALYLIISVLGLFGPELVYALHLFDVINRFPTLKNVARAVTANGRQLIMTSVLGIIFIFIYTLFGFWFLDDLYFDTSTGERTCTSMLHCFIVTLNNGIRNIGGIGDSTLNPSFESHTRLRWWTKVIWELTFFIVVDIIIINLVLGIILETFAVLRGKKAAQDKDMHSKCYICNIECSELDKTEARFQGHIKKSHHLWNYVYYFYMLKKKDEMVYNGIESYVTRLIKSENISWFPIGKALDLTKKVNAHEHSKH